MHDKEDVVHQQTPDAPRKRRRVAPPIAAAAAAAVTTALMAAHSRDQEVEAFRSEQDLVKAMEHLRQADPALAPLIDAHGPPLKLLAQPGASCFMALAKSIVFQQLNGKAAGTIFGRVMALCGTPAQAEPGAPAQPAQLAAGPAGVAAGAAPDLTSPCQVSTQAAQSHAQGSGAGMPGDPAAAAGGDAAPALVLTPEAVLGAEFSALRGCGLSENKARYLVGLARAFSPAHSPQPLTDEVLRRAADEQLVTCLTALHGVGAWTAHMTAMFNLGRPNILPTGDLAVKRGMQALYGLPQEPSPAAMAQLADRWRPYRSLGSWYMWRVMESAASAPKQVKTKKAKAKI